MFNTSNMGNDTANNSDSNLNIEVIILNLKLISKIKQNEKIIIDNKMIKIDSRLLKNIRRWFTSDGREESIEYIEYIINETINYINNPLISNEKIYTKEKIVEELSKTINGLDNLKSTYIKSIFPHQRIHS